MSKLFLSLHKMTPVKSDGKTSVFHHSDGHEVHVKHSAISPKMRSELEQLVKTKMAKGGSVEPKKFAEGDAVSTDPVLDATAPDAQLPNASEPAPPQSIQQEAQNNPPDPTYLKAKYEAENTSANDLPLGNATPQQMLDSPTPGSAPSPDEIAATALQKKNDEAVAPAAPQPEGIAPPAKMPDNSQPTANPMMSGYMAGANDIMSGIQKESQAKQLLATQQQAALQVDQNARQEATAHYQENINNLNNERANIMEDIKNSHIDPNKYMNTLDTTGKISTAIGLVLGGIGGGMTHQENPALKYLNAQIDRNIDAQKQELGKKENLLSANFKQFGNLQMAADFTRINNLDNIKNQLEMAAAKAGTPMAQAEALKAKGAIEQQIGMYTAKMGAQMTLNSPRSKESDVQGALQSLRMFSPETAKEFEGRYVPSVGVASKPVPDGAQQQFNATRDFDTKMKDLYAFAVKHAGETRLTNPADVLEGKAKAQAAQNSYRSAQDMGVWKKSEAPLLEVEIPSDPTAFFNAQRVLPAYKAVIDNNSMKFNNLKSSYGVKPFADTAPQQQANFAPKTFQKAK